MTVGELVEKLQQYPVNMPIVIQVCNCADFGDCIKVRPCKGSCINNEYIILGR